MSFREFSLDIDRQMMDAMDKAGDTVADVAYATFVGISDKTPVLTGLARGNWDMTIGAPGQAEWTIDPDGVRTKNRAQLLLSAYSEYDEFPELWITNNLPYINALEDGYSMKAPGGMVALTVAEVEAMYADIEL